MAVIEFKSLPIYFDKERSGVKNNTVRELSTEDDRYKVLVKRPLDLWIKIINSENGRYFLRKIRDVSIFKKLIIITWEHKEK